MHRTEEWNFQIFQAKAVQVCDLPQEKHFMSEAKDSSSVLTTTCVMREQSEHLVWLHVSLDLHFEEPTCKPDSTCVEQNEQRREHHTGYIQQKRCHKPPDPVEDGKGNWQG